MALLGNILYVGDLNDPQYTFRNEEIVNVKGEFSISLIGSELNIDTLTPEVLFEVIPPKIFKPTNYDGILTSDELVLRGKHSDDIRDLKYGTPMWYYIDGRLIGKYYLKYIERKSKNVYQVNAFSSIGLLDKMEHYGGIYINAKFQDVLADILRKDNRPCRIPYRYQEIEYIGSLGGQYIDTNFHPTSETKVTVKFHPTSNLNKGMIFGVRQTDTYPSFGLGMTKKNSSNIIVAEVGPLADMSLSDDITFSLGWDYKAILNRHEIIEKEDPETHIIILEEHRYVELDNKKVDILPAEITFTALSESMYIFATNEFGTATDSFIGRISEVTVEINNSVVHNYIACRDRFQMKEECMIL